MDREDTIQALEALREFHNTEDTHTDRERAMMLARAEGLLQAALELPEPTWRERCAELYAEAKRQEDHYRSEGYASEGGSGGFRHGMVAKSFEVLGDAAHGVLANAQAYLDDARAGAQLERARRMAYPSAYAGAPDA